VANRKSPQQQTRCFLESIGVPPHRTRAASPRPGRASLAAFCGLRTTRCLPAASLADALGSPGSATGKQDGQGFARWNAASRQGQAEAARWPYARPHLPRSAVLSGSRPPPRLRWLLAHPLAKQKVPSAKPAAIAAPAGRAQPQCRQAARKRASWGPARHVPVSRTSRVRPSTLEAAWSGPRPHPHCTPSVRPSAVWRAWREARGRKSPGEGLR